MGTDGAAAGAGRGGGVGDEEQGRGVQARCERWKDKENGGYLIRGRGGRALHKAGGGERIGGTGELHGRQKTEAARRKREAKQEGPARGCPNAVGKM
ncbi:hypothetical protein Tco_0874351 [Tanacetum coccineum]|uniref:Uncharacterized protein n=1 Tax=Tanacetum coccineum TaxID=301880 RepID=A0ABQ5BLC5_9ASTR